ncbi:MAG: hypothetical protein P8N76_27530 [Pirellulaceae bacterium]|nr:hypothetical protein [Pirellulaceae bacterium]
MTVKDSGETVVMGFHLGERFLIDGEVDAMQVCHLTGRIMSVAFTSTGDPADRE